MKNHLAGIAIAATLLGTPAFAADMALKAPPVAPAWNWTGWYAGLNVGGSFGKANDSVSFGGLPLPAPSQNLNGVIGGGQIGYNWQSGTWLFGLEADIQGSSEKSNDPALSTLILTIPALGAGAIPFSLGVNEKLDWFGTLRGRVGILATPTWLFYATGGLAYGGIKTTETLSAPAPIGIIGTNSFNNTRAGWTLGGGAEAVLGNNWTAKVEYLYLDLGTFSNVWASPIFPVAFSSHVTDNIVRAGVNYHFH